MITSARHFLVLGLHPRQLFDFVIFYQILYFFIHDDNLKWVNVPMIRKLAQGIPQVKEPATAQFINTQEESQSTLSEYSTNIMYMLRLYGNMIVMTTKNRN